MEVDVVDALGRLAAQARGVEIVDLAFPDVEQIEAVETHAPRFGELVADTAGDKRRGARAHAVVLDQGPRAEIAQPHAAEPAVQVVDVEAGGDPPLDRSRDALEGVIAAGFDVD